MEEEIVYITHLPKYLLKGYKITVKIGNVYYYRTIRHNSEFGIHIIVKGKRIKYNDMKRSTGLFIPDTLHGRL
jgi:hypothetical protein